MQHKRKDTTINETESENQVSIAVVGSGLAGLSASYFLSHDKTKNIKLYLFERNSKLGLDAASISVGPKRDFRIDVPMRSFMSGYYSHLFKLYKHLNIPAKAAKFSFGWYKIVQGQGYKQLSDEDPAKIASFTNNESYLIYSGARTIGSLDIIKTKDSSTALNLLYNITQSLWRFLIVSFSYLWIMFISLWMHHRGHLKNPHHSICNMTLGGFFKTYYVHPFFAHEIFVPLFAAVCTNSYKSMLDYPAADILEYMAVGLFQESYIAECGVKQVVENISKPFENVHLETEINVIQPSSTHRFELIDQRNNSYHVDHIIFATQGNQASKMLKKYHKILEQQEGSLENHKDLKQLQNQIDMLGKFRYDAALVINHTDTRLLPTDRSNWKALNLAIVDKSINPGKSDLIVPYPHDTTMATHILNMTHSQIDNFYLQTTNPCLSVDPEKILSVTWFERATVTLESKRALQQQLYVLKKDKIELGPCQGKNGIWFVGSYCWKGIPLLEGCVASAQFVVVEGIAKAENIDLQMPY